jgi:hypothetical protein
VDSDEIHDVEATAVRLKNQVIFGWLYLRYHIGDALGWFDPVRLSRYVSPKVGEGLISRAQSRDVHFLPVEVRPGIQLIRIETLMRGDGYVFVIREDQDSELSQLIAPGSGFLEATVEVIDASAWRLLEAQRVPALDRTAIIWTTAIAPTGGIFLTQDGRQVIVGDDGSLEAKDLLDEVQPRYRVEPESGRGQWYRTSDLERAVCWARHFSLEEDQRYLVYDRESLEPSGSLVSVYTHGEAH